MAAPVASGARDTRASPWPTASSSASSSSRAGLDGLTAPDIASALGYKNIKTNTFSARLSAARQFGLLVAPRTRATR